MVPAHFTRLPLLGPRLTISGRYLVVKSFNNDMLIYIHNAYAPADRQGKHHFFSSLDDGEYDDNATYLLLGNLSTPLNPRLDSSSPDLRYDQGRFNCLKWLV